MVRLTSGDLDRVARFSAELAAADDDEPFPEAVLDALRRLVNSESAGYCELDRIDRRLIALAGVPDTGETEQAANEVTETYWRLRHEYPTCVYEDRTGDFSSRKLSDFVTQRELRRLEIYADFFRPNGIEYEIGVGLSAPLTHTKVFMFANGRHGRDFGERERTILDLLRPQLELRYKHAGASRRARAALATLESSDEALVLLDNAGRAEFGTGRAVRLLAAHELTLADVPNVKPLVARRIRRDVLLLAERRPCGLTGREREILALVAEGRTNAEAASALWISASTVRKHLENAYRKLGVRTRTAAVRRAREQRILDWP